MTTSQNVSNIENIEQRLKCLSEREPEWMRQWREENLSRFNELGFPTTKDEEWKYTNIKSVINGPEYKFPNSFDFDKNDELKKLINEDEINLVTVNGRYIPELSNVDQKKIEGLTLSCLGEALQKNENLKDFILKYPTQNTSAFTALNNAIGNTGGLLHLSKGAIISPLIHIVHIVTGSMENAITLPKTLLLAEKSSEATVLETFVCFNDDLKYLTIPVTDIFLEENATVHYCKAQKDSLKASHIGVTQVWQERNSFYDGFTMTAGGSLVRNNLNIVSNGEGTDSTLNGLYSLRETQLADNHTAMHHNFPNCTSNQLYKGILNGSSRAVFNGKVFVQPIAQLTNAYQLNQNLLIGKDCRVDTKPQLEIFADDVKCTHGATIGQMDEDQMFYLQTRCISKREATKMLARGFVDDVLETLKSDSINEKLHLLLQPSFDQF